MSQENDPLVRVVAGPVLEEYQGANVRVDTNDEQRLVLLYVLRPGTNEAASVLTFSFAMARSLAHWILGATAD